MFVGGRRRWATVVALCIAVAIAVCGCGTITTEPTVRSTTEARAPKTSKVQGVPGSVELAAIAPGTADLMARIRATDPCSLLNREFAERLGTFQGFDRSPGAERGGGWTGCGLIIAANDAPDASYLVNVELDKVYTSDKRVGDTAEQVNGRIVFRGIGNDDARPDASSCDYRIPVEDTGFAHGLTISKVSGPTKAPVPWSKPCQFTKDYLAATIDNLMALRARPTEPGPRSLVQRDPCAAEPQISTQFPGWEMSSVGWTKAYKCAITLVQTGGTHRSTVEVSFEQSSEQMVKAGEILRLPSGLDGGQSIQYARHMTLDGLTGIEIRSVQSTDPTRQNTSCGLTLNYRRADPPTANNAHLVRVSLNLTPATPPFPFDACTQAAQIAPTVIESIR